MSVRTIAERDREARRPWGKYAQKGSLSDGVMVSAKVPREHVEALESRARAADRTLSAEIRMAIRSHLSDDAALRVAIDALGCPVDTEAVDG